MNKKITMILTILSLFLVGCTLHSELPKQEENHKDTGFVMATAGIYDSADTAVVVSRNDEESAITFRNLDIGRQYTLHYDRTTYINDKYEESMSIEQILPGDIVDITFFKERKRINSITISPLAWTYSQINQVAIDKNGKSMTIVNESFPMNENVVIISEGGQAELMDLHETDFLTVKGINHEVLSIVVDKGHGYLRLVNDEYFVGGWIEVGQALIQPISEGMLLTVPEGTYQVLVSNKGAGGTKEVTIERNGEVELDIGDLKGEEVKIGNILFSITPSMATVLIDGKEVSIAEMVPLEYGIHEMQVKMEGYKTIRQYLKVGQEYANISVEMEEITEIEDTVSENKVSDNKVDTNNNQTNSNSGNNSTVSGNNAGNGNSETGSTTTYKVKIESPKGAEVYLDGNYVGIAPVEFKKEQGNHTITLRKSGFQTRSYSIQVDSEKKDIAYSFSDLVASEAESESESE